MSHGWRPPINSCDYDLSGEILRWVLGPGNIRPRDPTASPVVPANLFTLNQTRFLPPGWTPATALVDPTGFIYIPERCQSRGVAAGGGDPDGGEPRFSASCGIHVHYHPCGGSWRVVSLAYMLQNALPAYAEANDIVILFPQSAAGNGNPVGGGCFDWYGATHPAFDTRDGVQINMVLAMIRGLRSGP